MQIGFRTGDIYDSLYREHCRAAWEIHQDPHPDWHCDAVHKCLAQFVEQLAATLVGGHPQGSTHRDWDPVAGDPFANRLLLLPLPTDRAHATVSACGM